MADYDCSNGFIIALEGSYDVVATQLLLLPISPQILILPALESNLETSEEPVSSPQTIVPRLRQAVQARHAAAVEFLRHSSALQRRYVFLHGGTAKTWSTAAQLVKGRKASSGHVTSALQVLHCHAGPDEPATPRSVYDEPMARAMRAADALDRQTATLQSMPTIDCPPEQCSTIPHFWGPTDRLTLRATIVSERSPSRRSATLGRPVSAVSNLSSAPPSPVIVELGKARLIQVPASRTGESPSKISPLSAVSVEAPTGTRCSVGNQVQSDAPLITLVGPEAFRLRRHDSKLSVSSSSDDPATRLGVAAGSTTRLGGTRADFEDVVIHLADSKADSVLERMLKDFERCCSRSAEHDAHQYEVPRRSRRSPEGKQSSHLPRGNLPPTPAGTPPSSYHGPLHWIHRICQADQQSPLSLQNMIREAINAHTQMSSAGRESLNYTEFPAFGPSWRPLFSQDSIAAINIVAMGGERSVSGAVLAATSQKLHQMSREVDNDPYPARLDLRYLQSQAVMTSQIRRMLCTGHASSVLEEPEVHAASLVPELELYLATNSSIKSLVLDFDATQLPLVVALRQIIGKDRFKVAYVGSPPEQLTPEPALDIDVSLRLPTSESQFLAFVSGVCKYLGRTYSVQGGPSLPAHQAQSQAMPGEGSHAISRRNVAPARAPLVRPSTGAKYTSTLQAMPARAALPITNMAVPARGSSRGRKPLAPPPLDLGPCLTMNPPSPAPSTSSNMSFASASQTRRTGLSQTSSLRAIATLPTPPQRLERALSPDTDVKPRLRPACLAHMERRRSSEKAMKLLGII